MTKAELVDQVTTTVQLPKHQTEAVITQFLGTIMAAVQTEQQVDLRGFGSFRLPNPRPAQDATHARTTRSRFPRNTSPRLPQKKLSKRWYPATAQAHST